ncbi:MAG: hypothetical protein ACE5OY_07560 [Candidatus Bathyarchaeia archaeon]
MGFPYAIKRKDIREVEVGFSAKIMFIYHRVVNKIAVEQLEGKGAEGYEVTAPEGFILYEVHTYQITWD